MGLSRIKFTIHKALLRRFVLTALAALTLPVMAQEQAGGYWYGGIGVGRSDNDGENRNIIDVPFAGLCTTFPCASDDSDTGYKLFAGYQFNELLGLEAEYARLPNTLDVQSVDSTVVPTSTFRVSQDSNVFSLRGVLSKRIYSPVSISAVLGASLWRSDLDASVVGGGLNIVDSERDYGLSLSFGARINYDFNDNIRLRGSWDRYTNLGDASAGSSIAGPAIIAHTVDTDTDLFSLELVYRFR